MGSSRFPGKPMYKINNIPMIEHVYKDSLQACLYSKRVAKQEVNPERVVFKCKKVKAETEVYQERKRIIKIIE